MTARPIVFCSHVVELGGAENVLLDLLGALDRDRFAPHLVVPHHGPLATRAEGLGVGVHDVPIGGRSPLRKALSTLRARRALRALADHLGAELLVANSMIAGYACVHARRRDLAAVWHLHVVVRAAVARAALRRATAVIAPSAIALRAAGVGTGEVVPNGVPDRFFRATAGDLRRELDVPATTPLVGIVGRLDPHKGHTVLVEALAGLDGADAPHLVVAGGELFTGSQNRIAGFAAELRARVAARGLSDRVHWLGELADTAPLLAALDVLAVPSTSPESAPRTIAEAQAAGCPVVASDTGGVRELLGEGASGVLVPPGDVTALQAGLMRVLTDPDEKDRLVAAARRRAQEHYRLEQFARRCERVFEQAIATTARSRS
ncbi:MAG TPA: glycosyltransferase family 1 protein [bacterium]|nr:glycosyltransferase family 1 protein [bacterium]